MRVRVIFALAVFAAQPALSCDLVFPEGYVVPTKEELVSQSEAAFVGHVVAYRLDDGATIKQDITCPNYKGDNCWERRESIVTAILAVDVDIRGMDGQRLFEDDRSPDSGADCGNDYAENAIYLVTGFGPTRLLAMPDQSTIAAWRNLRFVGVSQ